MQSESLPLEDKTLADSMIFHPPIEWISRMEAQIETAGLSMGFRESNGDPDAPPPGQKCLFRVCDAYRHFYSQYQKGLKCQFFPEDKRDTAILAYRDWLEAMK